MVRKQTTSALPHLPRSIAMPQVQITGDRPMMPGQKSLPSADWKNGENQQQLVPGIDHNNSRQKKMVAKQGVPCTSRPSKTPLPANIEPPPMFSSQPSTVAAIRSATESKTQKQMHRMEGGIDPVDILTTRLESWRLAIKNLVTMLKKVILVESRTSKGLAGASKEIEIPFRNSNGQFLESGGIQDVFSAIRDYTMQHSIMQHESSGYIQGAVVPALRAIKSDIKTVIIQIEKDRSLKSNIIYDCRTNVNRLIDRLNKIIETTQYAPHTANQNPDPFLLNLSVIHAIRDLCDHENRLHDNIMNLQQEVAIFEQKIIENIRHILHGYRDYRLENKMDHPDIIGPVTDAIDNMEPSTEWNSFVQRNQYNLVQANSAYKTENDVDYPNQHNKFVRASKIGPLQLKTGITKNWTEGIYILTPAGYLHGYKTPRHFQSNPLRPTYSIFIPSSTVEANDDVFEVHTDRDKKVSVGSRYYFRAPTREENQSWYDSLSSMSERFSSAPLLETTETNFANTPSHRDLPPLPANILPIEDSQQRRAIEAPAPPPPERDYPAIREPGVQQQQLQQQQLQQQQFQQQQLPQGQQQQLPQGQQQQVPQQVPQQIQQQVPQQIQQQVPQQIQQQVEQEDQQQHLVCDHHVVEEYHDQNAPEQEHRVIHHYVKPDPVVQPQPVSYQPQPVNYQEEHYPTPPPKQQPLPREEQYPTPPKQQTFTHQEAYLAPPPKQQSFTHQENRPSSPPKQQYYKAYPASSQVDDELEKKKAQLNNSKSRKMHKSKIQKSNTISGDNQLDHITAGGHASSNNYVSGDQIMEDYRDPSDNEFESEDLSRQQYDENYGYEPETIKTDLYDSRYSEKNDSKGSFGKYDDKNNIGKYAYSAENPEKYSIGVHKPGDHGKYAQHDYDKNSSSTDNYSTSDSSERYENHTYTYGKNFLSGGRNEYNADNKYTVTGNKYSSADNNYHSSNKHSNISNEILHQHLDSNDSLGGDHLRYNSTKSYQSKLVDRLDDNTMLGHDEYTNSKYGSPGL